MTSEEYWKLKSQLLQLKLEEAQLDIMYRDLEVRRSELYRDNNLKGNLRFDDAKFTIEEIPNG